MVFRNVLIANRGEIAIRIARALDELGIPSVAIYSEDDANSLHVRRAGEARPLKGVGVVPYLDIEQIVAAAQDAGCDAIHPGYGFLSENAEFARRCADGGLTFVGPSPEMLELLGDKVRARELAGRCGVPVIAGTSTAIDLDEIRRFYASLGADAAIMIKAVAGGGGRGMRVITSADQIDEAFSRCESEARAAFGNGALYAERLILRARHIEVQIIGDGSGEVSHLYERECTIQRRNQKLVEVAPSPSLTPELRASIIEAAVRLARELRYRSLGTFEFLVDTSAPRGEGGAFAFIEANPRLQVEHTVTEEVTDIDLVKLQLRLAAGATLEALGMTQRDIPRPHGYAIQTRVNLEAMNPDGSAKPTGGTIAIFEPPSGPGVRVDTFGYSGYTTSPRFDSLLAKLIVHSRGPDYAGAIRKCRRALEEFRIEGVATNLGFLEKLLEHPEFAANRIYTRFIDDRAAELAALTNANGRLSSSPASATPRLAGVKLASSDPLAVLNYGKSSSAAAHPAANQAQSPAPLAAFDRGPEGAVPITSPMQGTIVSIAVQENEQVRAGQQVLVMEAMKMEHVIRAAVSGTIRAIPIAPGDAVFEGHPLLFIEEGEVEGGALEREEQIDPDYIRPDLAEVNERHAFGLDEARPDAVERRRKTAQRTARENIEDLCDPGTFVEYGPLVIAAQRRRRQLDDLIKRTPADGMVAGIGQINGDYFDEAHSRCMMVSYDYTVLAGTQGTQNHRKKDRVFEIARQLKLPVVFFTEGGGGRPGDTDGIGIGLECLAFKYWGGLSGLVPLVGINSGRCFAGNAAILGCCDVVIATANSNIGMGGPAMIEGGGLGVFRPEEVGPMSVQRANGVVDVAVKDEAEAVQVARRYLSYFQGPLRDWSAADQRLLRSAIPENRLRVYDIRALINALADADSVLELRRDFGLGMVTALIRIEGRPLGLIANNPAHLAGAIDSDAADKAARFMQLCDAFDLPILFLCDTPGIMVGPEVERTALVRHASRMFVVGANVTVPVFTIVLRKGYGLGAQAMAGGSFKAPLFTVTWPTGEFGGMGLEGAVKLAYRNELAAIDDPAKRKELYDQMVEKMYQHGKAVEVATTFELDDVIDPAESRRWIMAGLRACPPPLPREGKKRPCIDTW